MKYPSLVLVSMLLSATCRAEPPNTKDDFLAAVRSAYEMKDIKRIHELTWEKGMSDFDKKQQDQILPMILGQSGNIESVSFEPLPPDFMKIHVAFGRRIEATHPADGMLKLVNKPTPKFSDSSMTVAYAVIDGRYYLVTGKSTDLGWKGPPDKPLNVMALGAGQDKVKIHVKYNASGVDLEMDMSNASGGFPGQYINEVTVKSESDDVDVTLRLLDEKGAAYYESEPLKGRGEIHYRKGDKSP